MSSPSQDVATEQAMAALSAARKETAECENELQKIKAALKKLQQGDEQSSTTSTTTSGSNSMEICVVKVSKSRRRNVLYLEAGHWIS
jgi:multidrug resistance efflux pump